MIVESDMVLDPVIDAMGDFARERGVTLVAAVARVDRDGGVVVRCKGRAPDSDRINARAMLECLEALTELKAAADPARRMPEDPDTVH